MTPLKNSWLDLYTPITQHLKLDMRMNLKTRKVRQAGFGAMTCCSGFRTFEAINPGGKQVEIKSTPDTPDIGSLQKAADFINAFILGQCLHPS